MQQNIDQSVMYPQPHLVRTALTVGLRVGPSVGLRVRRGARCGAVRRSGAALLGSTTAETDGRASRPPEAACAWRSGLSRVPRPGPQEARAQLASRRPSRHTAAPDEQRRRPHVRFHQLARLGRLLGGRRGPRGSRRRRCCRRRLVLLLAHHARRFLEPGLISAQHGAVHG